jgi:hypothetical protein
MKKIRLTKTELNKQNTQSKYNDFNAEGIRSGNVPLKRLDATPLFNNKNML